MNTILHKINNLDFQVDFVRRLYIDLKDEHLFVVRQSNVIEEHSLVNGNWMLDHEEKWIGDGKIESFEVVNSQIYVSGTFGKFLELFPRNFQTKIECPVDGGAVWTMSYNDSFSIFALGTEEGVINLISVPSMESFQVIRRGVNRIICANWNDNGRLLAMGGNDVIDVYTMNNENKSLKKYHSINVGHQRRFDDLIIWKLLFLPNYQMEMNILVSGDSTGTVSVWNVEGEILLKQFKLSVSSILDMILVKERRMFYCVGMDHCVWKLSYTINEEKTIIWKTNDKLWTKHKGDIETVQYYFDEKEKNEYLLTGSADCDINIINLTLVEKRMKNKLGTVVKISYFDKINKKIFVKDNLIIYRGTNSITIYELKENESILKRFKENRQSDLRFQISKLAELCLSRQIDSVHVTSIDMSNNMGGNEDSFLYYLSFTTTDHLYLYRLEYELSPSSRKLLKETVLLTRCRKMPMKLAHVQLYNKNNDLYLIAIDYDGEMKNKSKSIYTIDDYPNEHSTFSSIHMGKSEKLCKNDIDFQMKIFHVENEMNLILTLNFPKCRKLLRILHFKLIELIDQFRIFISLSNGKNLFLRFDNQFQLMAIDYLNFDLNIDCYGINSELNHILFMFTNKEIIEYKLNAVASPTNVDESEEDLESAQTITASQLERNDWCKKLYSFMEANCNISWETTKEYTQRWPLHWVALPFCPLSIDYISTDKFIVFANNRYYVINRNERMPEYEVNFWNADENRKRRWNEAPKTGNFRLVSHDEIIAFGHCRTMRSDDEIKNELIVVEQCSEEWREKLPGRCIRKKFIG
ncbi:hypothetical protein SNEBB_005013 [Seison nebaliae]|nr:hypothetical protein SNEBB_005013 [Seison nebaliae]